MKHSLNVWTSTVQKYTGGNKLDITVKSGEKAFAPTWDMVKHYKTGGLSMKAYEHVYLRMMEASAVKNKIIWSNLLKQESVVLCCYCRPGDFCHRHILADILVSMGATKRGEI